MLDSPKEGDLFKLLSEKDIEGVRTFAEQTLGWKVGTRRIRSFRVLPKVRNPSAVTVEIGKYLDHRLGDYRDEEVGVILESNAILVCTANRGVLRGMPYLFGSNDVFDVVYLDGERRLD